jgi:hypothetical protein
MHKPWYWIVQFTRRQIGYAAGIIPFVVSPGIALAVTLSCPDQDITVTAPDVDLANRVCSRAAASRDILESCHLRQTKPFLIEVSALLSPELDGCFGVFHCDDDVIKVLAPDALSGVVQRTGSFTNLPPDVLFDSLIIHEISHALVFQSSTGSPKTAAEVEYIPYVMQMKSLPEDARAAFVAAHPVTKPVSLMGLNDVILAFSPEVFAIKAWTHFQSEGNGCDFVRKILKREVSFPSQ